MTTFDRVAALLPDFPRWVEARAALLAGRCELTGLREGPRFSVVMRDGEDVFVIGQPDEHAVRAAASAASNLVAPTELAGWLTPLLPGWTATRVIVHVLLHAGRLPDPAGVRHLDPARIPDLSLDEELRGELLDGAEGSPIAASFVDNTPVAFCHAGAVTETWWDIAIDTVSEHRQKGHAARAAAFMIGQMSQRPVWQSDVKNPPSWRLAEKLGFVAVDEVEMFERTA